MPDDYRVDMARAQIRGSFILCHGHQSDITTAITDPWLISQSKMALLYVIGRRFTMPLISCLACLAVDFYYTSVNLLTYWVLFNKIFRVFYSIDR